MDMEGCVGPNLCLVIEELLVPEPLEFGLSPLPSEAGPRTPEPPRAPEPALEGGLFPCQGLLLFVIGLKVQCCCYCSNSMSLGSLSGIWWNS